jgi:hypothetical protein
MQRPIPEHYQVFDPGTEILRISEVLSLGSGPLHLSGPMDLNSDGAKFHRPPSSTPWFNKSKNNIYASEGHLHGTYE